MNASRYDQRDPSLLAAQLGLVIVMAGLIGTFAYHMPRDFTVRAINEGEMLANEHLSYYRGLKRESFSSILWSSSFHSSE